MFHPLVLVLIKGPLTIKRMVTLRHPYTRVSFLCQCLQADIGKRMLSSPPASPLPKYGRNRIRAGRRTKTQSKRVIRANVCLVRRPCQNHLIVDTHQCSRIENPAFLHVYMVAFKRIKWYVLKQAPNPAVANPHTSSFQISPFCENKIRKSSKL